LNCVVVHPGAHKTASSFIQKAIRADANTLERQLGLISRGYRDLTDIPIMRDDPFGYCNAVLNFFGLRFSSLPQRPENISLSDTALRVALAAYPHLEQKERRSLRKYLQRQLSGPAYEKFYPFTAQEVSSFLTAYAPETERLTKLLQPRFSSYVLRWLDRA
jgi:hypothetical protein